MAKNALLWALSLLLGATHVGCKDCQDETDAMHSFLVEPAHLGCESSEDCTVVTVGCHVRDAFCGQMQLNKTAAASSGWKNVRSAANDCEDESCDVCSAALIAQCKEGFCGGPP